MEYEMNESSSKNFVPKQSVFLDYFRVLRSRKWTVLFCMLVVIIPIMIWTYLSPSIYEASATIIYEEPKDTMFALDVGQPFYNKSSMVNLTEQIKSRTLAEAVAQVLPREAIAAFRLPETLPPDFIEYKFIARQLRKNLSVSLVRGGEILTIKIEARSPKTAQTIANTYARQILDWNLNKKKEETTNIRLFVEEQLNVFQKNLVAAEDSLRIFREMNEMVTLNEASNEILTRMTDAEVSYNQARTERLALEQRKRYIDKKNQEIIPSFSLVSTPATQQLNRDLVDLETQYSANKLKGYLESSPEMISLRYEIGQVKQRIIQEVLNTTQRDNLIDPLSQIRDLLQESVTLEVDLETFRAREGALKRILEDYEIKLQMLPQKELNLAHLIRDREVNDKIYSMLLEKLQEARISEASKVGDIHIIDEAEEPDFPVKPNKRRNMMLAVLLGLGFGVGFAFFLESLDTSIKSQEDIEKFSDLTVLTSIPSMHTNGNILKKGRQVDGYYLNKLIPNINKDTPTFEAYRSLEVNFAFVNTDENFKRVLITSPGAGEGKTLTSINMAKIFAASGRRTLLIDCDLRRPMIHKILHVKQTPGLTDALVSKIVTIKKMGPDNFNVMTCGTIPPNPSAILGSKRMMEMLNEFNREFDLVILDSPPIIAVADSMILSSKVDGIILVVRSSKTAYGAVATAKNIINKSKGKLIGVILNDVNYKNVYGYYNYYYSKNAKSKRKNLITT